jgi:anthranilate synthase component 1
VEQVKEYIRAGDCMRVVLARRFESRGTPPPLSLYRALRRVNPSPYLFLVELGMWPGKLARRVLPSACFGLPRNP